MNFHKVYLIRNAIKTTQNFISIINDSKLVTVVTYICSNCKACIWITCNCLKRNTKFFYFNYFTNIFIIMWKAKTKKILFNNQEGKRILLLHLRGNSVHKWIIFIGMIQLLLGQMKIWSIVTVKNLALSSTVILSWKLIQLA